VLVDDQARFERLYRGYAGVVLTFARRRTSPTEAEDVVADVFLAAWRRLEEVPADPLPWLLGIARGVLSNRRRGAERSSALIARLEEVEPAVPVGEEAWTPDGRVLRALRALAPADQELLLLVAWDQLNRRQVAHVLGTSAGTVAVRLHRARRRLARALNPRAPARSHETAERKEVVR
jgi:RNA polymerase sigma-70 factor (ECF subfamily)